MDKQKAWFDGWPVTKGGPNSGHRGHRSRPSPLRGGSQASTGHGFALTTSGEAAWGDLEKRGLVEDPLPGWEKGPERQRPTYVLRGPRLIVYAEVIGDGRWNLSAMGDRRIGFCPLGIYKTPGAAMRAGNEAFERMML